MQLSIRKKAIASLAFVALGYALLSVSIRLLNDGFLPFTQVYLRIGLGFMLALVLFHKQLHPRKLLHLTKKDWLLLIFMGTFGYGFAIDFVTLGVLHTKLINVAVLGSTIPLFVFVYSYFFLKHHVNQKLFLFVILSVYGAIVLSAKTFIPQLQDFGIGDLYIILFAAGTACYSVCRRFLSKDLNNKEITVIVMFFAFSSSLGTALLIHEPLTSNGFYNPLVLLGLFIGLVLNTVLTQLENFSFQHIRPILGTQILLLENIFALFLGYILYNEYLSFIEFTGAFIILGSVLLSNLLSKENS